MKRLILFFIAVLAAGLAVQVHAAQILVFAAASLTDSLTQIATDYEKASGDKVVFNFGASGTLARQIEAGAPADLFLSADEARMEALSARHLLVAQSCRRLLGNTLVIVTPLDNTTLHSPFDLTNAAVKRIALGEVKIVPAGTYAKLYLESLKAWPAVESRIVPCENVRAVLAAVETGNVDAGIVYKTDAAISKKVRVAYEVPAADAPRITYPAAVLSDAPHPAEAGRFLDYLADQRAQAVFARFGFVILSAAGK